jgi:hypothetical protein
MHDHNKVAVVTQPWILAMNHGLAAGQDADFWKDIKTIVLLFVRILHGFQALSREPFEFYGIKRFFNISGMI